MTATATFWDGIAESYAAQPVNDPDAFERKIEITKALMKPSDVVLDIGCGTGSLALVLAPHAVHVHGLDISREMSRIAREKADKQGIDNVTFHTGPFDTFDQLDPGSLDGLCAYSILHLVDDLDGTLTRIFALLEPGGFFVSSTVCLGNTWVPYGAIISVMRLFGKAPPVVRSLSQDELEAAARRAGFVEVAVQDVGARDGKIVFMTARKPV